MGFFSGHAHESKIVQNFRNSETRYQVPIVIDGLNVGHDNRLDKCYPDKDKKTGLHVNWIRLENAVNYFKCIGCVNIKIVIPKYDTDKQDQHAQERAKQFLAQIELLKQDMKEYVTLDLFYNAVIGSTERYRAIRHNMWANGEIQLCPFGVDDDLFVLQLAVENKGLVISNDRFRTILERADIQGATQQKITLIKCAIYDSRQFKYCYKGNYRNDFTLYGAQNKNT